MYQSNLPICVILGTKCLWNFYLLHLCMYVCVCICTETYTHMYYIDNSPVYFYLICFNEKFPLIIAIF